MIPDEKLEPSIYEMHRIPVSDTHLSDIIERIADNISSMDIGMVLCDEQDVIHYANQTFEYLYGYNIYEPIGKNINVIFPPGEVPDKLYGTFNGNYDTVTKAGIKLTASISSSLFNSGIKLLFFRDNTSRKHSEGVFTHVEMKNMALIDILPDLMFIVKKDGTFIDYKVDNLARLSVPPEQLIGNKAGDVLPGSIAGRFMEAVGLAIETGQIQYFDYTIPLNGKVFFYEARCVAISGDEALIIARDFTERRLTEQHLAEALDLNTKIISTSPVGIVAYKANGQCVSANEIAARIFNTSIARILEQNLFEIKSWHVSDMLKAARDVIETRQPQSKEIRFVSNAGTESWLEMHFAHFSIGGESHVLIIFDDVTNLKIAQEALKKYELLTRNARDIILFVHMNGELMEVNEWATHVYGYTRKELLFMSIRDLRAPGAAARLEEQMKIADETGILFETIHRRKDGSMFPVEVSSKGATIGNERVLMSIVRDITERSGPRPRS